MIALVVVGVYYMFKWWRRSSYGYTGGLRVSVDGPRNVLKIGGLTEHIKGLSGHAAGRKGILLPSVSKLAVLDV